MRNFSLELKDTSEAEMQKFDRFMLQVLTQVSEEKKAARELDRYAREMYRKKNTYVEETFQSVREKKPVVNKNIFLRIIEWIRLNNGKSNIKLHKKSIQGLVNVIDILQTFKGHQIFCQIYQIEANVNLKKITFNTFVSGEHLLFVMSIHDVNNKMVFRFQSESYYGILALVKAIGYSVTSFNLRMIEITRILFLSAHNHKDKVDVIYERMPAFIIAKVRDSKSLQTDIDKLLGDYFSLRGTNEQKGVLNILNTLKIKDSEKLYNWLYENSEKVLKMYNWFSGIYKDNFLSIVLILAQKYSKKPKSSEYAVLPDGYWFKKQILATSVKGNYIEIKGFTSRVSNLESGLWLRADSMNPGSNTRASKYLKIKPQPGTDEFVREYITPVLMTPVFYKKPVELVNIRTVLSISEKETVILESSIVALYVKHIDEEVSNAAFWDAFNVVSTLAGGYGALRVITTKGAGWLLKSMAITELTKASIDLVMLSDRAKVALINAGLEDLVRNWTIISITADLAFLSFAGLHALAKYGKRGAKVLRSVDEAEQAAHLEEQAKKALEEIERRNKLKKPNKKAKFNPDQHSEFNDVYENIPGSKKPYTNPADEIVEEIKEIKNKTKNYDNAFFKKAEKNIVGNLQKVGISKSEAQDVFLRILYIDDKIGNNKMINIIDELLRYGEKYKNQDDLLENLVKCFEGKIPKNKESLDLLNELETGLREIKNGESTVISRKIKANGKGYEKFEKGGNELDVLTLDSKKIIECKRVSSSNGDAVRERINDIILKFNKNEKISLENLKKFPNHFGELKIDNINNPYYNLNKREFINKIRNDFFPNIENSGINKIKLQESIIELEVVNNKGIFKISKNEW